jgi:serine/threonine-protein kinase
MAAPQALTLAEIIRHGQMESRLKVRLWVDLLRALGEKHKQGVRFGTLDPESILIDTRHAIVLLESPLKPGSPYLAPELAHGEPVDVQADIYSMGVIMFELLTGGLEGLHRAAPSRVASDVPRWIDAIVLRCIMERRSQRYLDVEEIAQEFVRLKSVL